jgi:hypothetical protein
MSSYIRTQGSSTRTPLPSSIPNLILWLDAADNTTITGSSPVTAWRDKSGNANNATGAGTINLGNLANNINGVQCMVFPDRTGYFRGAISITTPGVTCFAVATTTLAQPNQAGNPDQRLVSIASSGNYDYNSPDGAILFFNQQTTNTIASWRNNTVSAIIGTPIVQFVPFLVTSQLDSTNSLGSMWFNGSFIGSGGMTSANFASTAYGISTEAQLTTNETWQGYIGEVIMYNTILTTVQRQNVEGYLAWKWGLQGSLPSTHPYSIFNYYNNISITLSLTNPLQLPGLIAWFDAADTTTYTPGATITSWRNKGSAGGNATSASGVSSTSSNINGLPAMTFAVGAVMTVPSLTYLDASKSMFAVVTIGALGTTNGIFTDSVSAAFWPQLTQGVGFLQYTTFGANVFLSVPSSTFGFFNATSVLTGHDYLISGTTYGGGIYVNGFLQPLSTNAPRAFTTGTRTSFVLGSSGSTAIKVMGEILVYDSSLTPYQRQQVETYLMYKWKVYPGVTPSPIARSILSNRTTGGFTYATFNPLSITGAQLWFDAADTSTMTFSGSTVTQWNDKSGNARNATNGADAAPTYSPKGFNGGYPGLFFNGSTTRMSTPAIIPQPVLSANGTDTSIFLVFNYNFIGANYAVYGLGSVDNTYVLRTPWTTGTFGTAIIDTTSTTTADRITFTFGSAQAAGQLYSILRSGALHSFYQYGSLTTSVSASGTVGTTSQTFNIGGANGTTGASLFFNSYISELIIYNVALTTAQQQQVEGYLAWKWGIQANLPAKHPYKLFPTPP